MGQRIHDRRVLQTSLVWVLFSYQDGSEFCFQTTLNHDELKARGIILEEGCLPRLDKQYVEYGQRVYRQFPFTGVKISLWDTLTYFDRDSELLHDFL